MYEMYRMVMEHNIDAKQEKAKEIWGIYMAEMKRLIKNPDTKPDYSKFDDFIKRNIDFPFARNIGSLFRDTLFEGWKDAEESDRDVEFLPFE